MIWHDLWAWVLAVVLARAKWQRIIDAMLSPARERRVLRHHGWTRSCTPSTHFIRCTCDVCVGEFDHFCEWRQIA